MYISVDLDSTYHLKHKYIGTYNIDWCIRRFT
jgi:hypothetical protein